MSISLSLKNTIIRIRIIIIKYACQTQPPSHPKLVQRPCRSPLSPYVTITVSAPCSIEKRLEVNNGNNGN